MKESKLPNYLNVEDEFKPVESQNDPSVHKKRDEAESEAHRWQKIKEMVLATRAGADLGEDWVESEVEKSKAFANNPELLEFSLFNSKDQYMAYLESAILARLESENE